MKRLLLTVALCVAASGAFAQKKAVTQAQNIAKSEKPNYDEARTLITGALTDPDSKDDPKTWYVAGYIEDQIVSEERLKPALAQESNEPRMYEAMIKIFPYFEKAYDLDNAPNEKGKVKPRFTKDMTAILTANHIYYINGGGYYLENRDYKKAYEYFEQYLDIANHPMMAPLEVDSNYMMVQYYAAVAATYDENHPLAIKTLEKAKDYEYEQNSAYQLLFEEYRALADTTNMERIAKEGVAKFPEESFYLWNLINIQIGTGANEQAIQYLDAAIAQSPNDPSLYDVAGRVYEGGLQDLEKAEYYFSKAVEIDPNFTDGLLNLGRIYYNRAVEQLGEANMITDSKRYQEESAKAKELFKQALPYFEKVHAADPELRDALVALRNIYYNLNMGDQYEAIDAKMGGSGE